MTGKFHSILRAASSFCSNTRGNVAFFVAVTAIPALIGVGAAIDHARLSRFSAQLKAASDAAALAGAAETVDPTIPLTAMLSAQRRTIATNAFQANMGAQSELSGITVTVTDIPNGIRVNANANAPHIFGQILGNEFTQLGAVSEAGLATISNYEVAFVLDNTGSMGASGKLTTLKSAMNKFLGKLQAAATSTGNVRVSIVPFSNMVKLNTTFAAGKPWIAQASYDLTV